MDRKHGRKRQLMRAREHRHERRRPIVHVQNLRHRSQSTRELNGGFAKENETRRVVVVSPAVLTINARPIKEIVTANQEQLHAVSRVRLEVLRDVNLLSEPYIDSHLRIFFLEGGVLANLAIKRQRDR